MDTTLDDQELESESFRPRFQSTFINETSSQGRTHGRASSRWRRIKVLDDTSSSDEDHDSERGIEALSNNDIAVKNLKSFATLSLAEKRNKSPVPKSCIGTTVGFKDVKLKKKSKQVSFSVQSDEISTQENQEPRKKPAKLKGKKKQLVKSPSRLNDPFPKKAPVKPAMDPKLKRWLTTDMDKVYLKAHKAYKEMDEMDKRHQDELNLRRQQKFAPEANNESRTAQRPKLPKVFFKPSPTKEELRERERERKERETHLLQKRLRAQDKNNEVVSKVLREIARRKNIPLTPDTVESNDNNENDTTVESPEKFEFEIPADYKFVSEIFEGKPLSPSKQKRAKKKIAESYKNLKESQEKQLAQAVKAKETGEQLIAELKSRPRYRKQRNYEPGEAAPLPSTRKVEKPISLSRVIQDVEKSKKLCEFFEQEINLQPRPLPRETQKINDAELEQSMSTEKEDNHQDLSQESEIVQEGISYSSQNEQHMDVDQSVPPQKTSKAGLKIVMNEKVQTPFDKLTNYSTLVKETQVQKSMDTSELTQLEINHSDFLASEVSIAGVIDDIPIKQSHSAPAELLTSLMNPHESSHEELIPLADISADTTIGNADKPISDETMIKEELSFVDQTRDQGEHSNMGIEKEELTSEQTRNSRNLSDSLADDWITISSSEAERLQLTLNFTEISSSDLSKTSSEMQSGQESGETTTKESSFSSKSASETPNRKEQFNLEIPVGEMSELDSSNLCSTPIENHSGGSQTERRSSRKESSSEEQSAEQLSSSFEHSKLAALTQKEGESDETPKESSESSRFIFSDECDNVTQIFVPLNTSTNSSDFEGDKGNESPDTSTKESSLSSGASKRLLEDRELDKKRVKRSTSLSQNQEQEL